MLKHPSELQEVQHAFSTRFPTRLRKKDIQFKEMKAILHAVRIWRCFLPGAFLQLYCDNDAVVQGVRKTTIRGGAMAPLREIVLLATRLDILVEIQWIPTAMNCLADDLSRFKLTKVADIYPQLRYL